MLWRRTLVLRSLVWIVALLGFTPFLQGRASDSVGRIVVVVNGRSPLSRMVAHEYCRLRTIPEERVLVLSDVPGSGCAGDEVIDLDACRTRILQPLLEFLEERDLEEMVDTVAYSAGFPYAVDFSATAKELGLERAITPTASLTGLTYFARSLLRGEDEAFRLDGNAYFRHPGTEATALADARDPWPSLAYSVTRAFRTDGGWFEDSAVLRGTAGNGRGGYLLATFLCWIGVRGNTREEAWIQLERSAMADDSAPSGTVYLLENGNVRATTRMPLFPTAVQLLRERERPVEILRPGESGQDGTVPRGKDDVLGAVIGAASHPWDPSSHLLPGSLAESLTSFGAHFGTNSQTKLTALLAAGAAGSSGTVREPFAIQAKFPTPLLHAYYADGCTLAEAYYQSVRGPYQLLIVGDPLCRPFPRSSLEGVDDTPLAEHADTALPSGAQRRNATSAPPALRVELPTVSKGRGSSGRARETDSSNHAFRGWQLEEHRGKWSAAARWEVPTEGVWEIGLRHRDRVTLSIGRIDQEFVASEGDADVFTAALFALAAGEHELRVEFPVEPTALALRAVGPQGTLLPEQTNLRSPHPGLEAGPALALRTDEANECTYETEGGAASRIGGLIVPGTDLPDGIATSTDGKRFRSCKVRERVRLLGNDGRSATLLRVRAARVHSLRLSWDGERPSWQSAPELLLESD